VAVPTPPAEGLPWDRVLALGLPPNEPRLVHRSELPATAARTAPLPDGLDRRLLRALRGRGIDRLWTHQAATYEAARAGRHVGVVTGTASGKSLAYGLPVLQTLLTDRHARALYLAPTKALAQDQARTLRLFGLGRDLRPALYDGDTDLGSRALARREANLFLTNPDMLHVGICPGHERWADVLSNLSHVIVDEAHVYRGVFGSHVANVLRRLRRVCALHGAAPQFLLASATIANPAEAMRALTGLDITLVDDDGAPRAARTVALWNPTLLDETTGERASALAEAAALVVSLVVAGQRVICFARSRRAVELIHRFVRDALVDVLPEVRDRVAPYRAGYTGEQRRELERRLASGELLAVVATSALELGIDIGLLDAAVGVGFPGTVAALRQQWGRAGRSGNGLAVLVASADALDQYFVRRPEKLLGRPVEAAILDHLSPEIHAAHLLCAAYEAPIAPRDDSVLGSGTHATAVARADPRGPLAVTTAGSPSPARGSRPRRRRSDRRARRRWRSSTRTPAPCSAASRPDARRARSTRARSTCIWARATRCRSSTSRMASRWSRASGATGTRNRGWRR
jgi:DEAD/DEAH box helicase domain-containing protein